MFEKAVIFATNAHNGQTRKGTNLPFIIHPLEVAAIVAAMTLDEDMFVPLSFMMLLKTVMISRLRISDMNLVMLLLLMFIRRVKTRAKHGSKGKVIPLIF